MIKRDHLRALISVGLALLAGLWVAAPALGTGAVLGAQNNDLDGALWYRWYLLDSLQSGRLPDTTPMVAFPLGTDMLVRDGCNLLDALLSLPLVLAFGPFVAHNIWVILLVAANWLAFAHASKAWLGDGAERFWSRQLGASLFALSPIALEELGNGRVTQAFLIWLALLAGECWRLDRSRWAWVRGGIWLALTGLTYWYAAIWGGALAALLGLSRSWRKTTAMLLLSLVLVSPLLLAYAGRLGGEAPTLVPQKHMFVLWWDGGTALMGPGDDVGRDPVGMGRLLGFEFVPGVVALVYLMWRERGPWLAVGGACAIWGVFALGPQPFGLFQSPLYALAMTLGPLAHRLWFPLRALVVVALTLAMALSAVAPRLERRWWGWPALALLLWPLALRLQGSMPLERWDPPRSPVIQWLAAQPNGAVIALPSTADSSWRAAQIQYGKAVQLSIGGENPALAVAGWSDWEESRPAMLALNDILLGQTPLQPPSPQDWAQLRADGFAYLLLDREKMSTTRGEAGTKTAISRIKRALGKPAEADAHYLAWVLPAADPR